MFKTLFCAAILCTAAMLVMAQATAQTVPITAGRHGFTAPY